MRHSASRHTRVVPGRHMTLFWLAPAGIHRFIESCPYAPRVISRISALLAQRLGRIMTEGRPCRFCAIAVTLATHTCVWLRVQVVGGLSSATGSPRTPSAALSLSYIYGLSPYLLLMEALTDEEGALAICLARTTLEKKIAGAECSDPSLTQIFSQKRGVFVTLTREGELRGCIGFPYPHYPLGEAIREAALYAALQDPRFPPVRAHELPILQIDITILSVPELLTADPDCRPACIEVGRHGLIIQGLGTSGLLLPQVAVEWGWDSQEFLDHTCRKAGLPAGCWRNHEVKVFTFEGQIFCEKKER
jgi:uncharacterized protein (TIGR00296 family)